MRLIECVPNFSEGRDPVVIEAIAAQIRGVDRVRLLNVDPGVGTNRTVYTFVGQPEAVCEAAFRAVRCASELIDMRQHRGTHPRLGATDVLPLVPISGVTLEECVTMARGLAERISHELQIPTYNYEAAASTPLRRNLATVRAGEYEGLPQKLVDPLWKPDFGPARFTAQAARSGATIVGARNFLVAVNFNLDTTSVALASAIAHDVRESGRTVDLGEWSCESGVWKRRSPEQSLPTGTRTQLRGTLVGCKAIGWYIPEYGIAQVSMNIINIEQTSLHKAYEEVSRAATARGVRVTGTEIIGLVPLKVLVDAGAHFWNKAHPSVTASESELVETAVRTMGLSNLAPFDPKDRVIEYLLKAGD